MFKKTLTALSLLAMIHGFNSAQAAVDEKFFANVFKSNSRQSPADSMVDSWREYDEG